MTMALLAVAAAALCSGGAAVLQAYAVSRLPTAESINAGFVGRLARSPRYLLALVLVACGFLLSILALRTLPLFVVQAGRASSLAITAVLSVLFLRVRLRRSEVLAVLGIGAGLLVVAATAGGQTVSDPDATTRWALPAAVLAAALAAVAALRVRNPVRAGLILALLAGLCFGLLALGARLLRTFGPLGLITDPVAWAMAGAGLLGLLLGAMALQRAAVVSVTSAMVATETIVGAALGWFVCGDRPAAGLAVPALAGFLVVLAGALLLARFGAPEPDPSGHEEPAALPIA
jgi:drug/metabolite transporter (DMT)-like permease